MVLWLVLAVMTGAAVFAVLWPLARNKPLREDNDVAVYRDQLDEIQRDRATGLIGEAEAEAARVEVSRRLLAAADAAQSGQVAKPGTAILHRRVTAIVALVLLPIGALSLYLNIGSPNLPGEPLSARLQSPAEARKIQTMIAEVEKHVARNPNDGRGWAVLAPVYMRLGRYDDAVRAWRNVIALNGSSAGREADYGEAMVAAANGVVTGDAKAAFDRALKIDPANVMARFYKGMAADQDGKRAEAEKIWNDLIAGAPPNAPWLEVVRHALARGAPAASATPAPGAPGPGAADVAAAAQMNPDQRQQMIQGMVARLAERLKTNGSDVQDWERLLRAYMVLGQRDKAAAAAADARKALASDPDKLRQLDGIIKDLKVEG